MIHSGEPVKGSLNPSHPRRLTAVCKMYKRYTFGFFSHSLGTRSWCRLNEIVMKEKEHKIRDHWVNVRMTQKEFQQLEANRKKSTCRTNSDYLRQIATNQPVKILTRDASLDAFTAEIIFLRKELNALGQNFNQAVRKLHTLKMVPEFRSWIILYEKTRVDIVTHTESICSAILQNKGQ